MTASAALYESLLAHSLALKSLDHVHQKLLEREKALADILETLKNGYNPNYQDMAVLEAVRGWEELKPKDGEEKEAEAPSQDDEAKQEETDTEEEGEKLMTAEELPEQIESLLDTDYVGLLFQHDRHINEATQETSSTPRVPLCFIPH